MVCAILARSCSQVANEIAQHACCGWQSANSSRKNDHGSVYLVTLLPRLESQGPETINDQVRKFLIDGIFKFVSEHNTSLIKAAAIIMMAAYYKAYVRNDDISISANLNRNLGINQLVEPCGNLRMPDSLVKSIWKKRTNHLVQGVEKNVSELSLAFLHLLYSSCTAHCIAVCYVRGIATGFIQ